MKFQHFYQRAIERKGSETDVLARLPQLATAAQLQALGDDRYLSAITKCVFRRVLLWRIIVF